MEKLRRFTAEHILTAVVGESRIASLRTDLSLSSCCYLAVLPLRSLTLTAGSVNVNDRSFYPDSRHHVKRKLRAGSLNSLRSL